MEILFVTLWSPRTDGGGTQQRAALHLSALSRLGRVHLLYAGDGKPVFDDAVAGQLHSVSTLRDVGLGAAGPGRPFSPGLLRGAFVEGWGVSGWLASPSSRDATALRRAMPRSRFDLVFAFHLGSALVADAAVDIAMAPRRVIDWDFLESANTTAWSDRGASGAGALRRLKARVNAWKVWRLEQRILNTWSLHLCSSPIDVPYLRARARGGDVAALANPCRVCEPMPGPCMGAVPTALFVGTMAYWPNLDAAQHLISNIWPQVRKVVPGARLLIVGRAMPPALLAVNGQEGVEIHADVPDLQPYYEQAHVALAPLRHVVGSNLKIAEAMAHARPVVGYRRACDRVSSEASTGMISVNDSSELVRSLISILCSPTQADALGRAAYWFTARSFERDLLVNRAADLLSLV